MKLNTKNILFVFLLFSSLVNAEQVAKSGLIDILKHNNITGLVTSDNRLFFYSYDDCKAYGCEACALQSSGDYEGWFACQGLGYGIKEGAKTAYSKTVDFFERTGKRLKKALSEDKEQGNSGNY